MKAVINHDTWYSNNTNNWNKVNDNRYLDKNKIKQIYRTINHSNQKVRMVMRITARDKHKDNDKNSNDNDDIVRTSWNINRQW